MSKNIITLFCFFLILSGCSAIYEDLSEARDLVSKKQYQAAIALLDNCNTSASKKYNSQVHIELAIQTLADLQVSKETRYANAKKLLEEALRLDPKNERARTFHLMILKLSPKENATDA